MKSLAGASLLLLLLTGCTTPLPISESPISAAMLIEGRPLTGGVEPAPLPDVDILAVDDDMRRFIRERVSPTGPDRWRLHILLRVLLREAGFVIQYQDRTYTAAEAFRLQQANCLSFTNLFVALAREAGLKVKFQEVDVPPDWSLSGDLLVQNRHINTFVDLGHQPEQIVDFNMGDFRTTYDRRVISDDRARAHYYSNVGVERMGDGATVQALLNFRRAIAADGSFVPAWTNLGALYRRAGKPDWAEAAWSHALALNPRELGAMSNLERLYREDGRVRLADRLRGRLDRYRRQNPYYRYLQAEAAFAAANYSGAIAHLHFAISRKANEDRFCALLGLAYLRQGDPVSAQRWLARAEELAGDDSTKDTYHGKLERLRREQGGAMPRGS